MEAKIALERTAYQLCNERTYFQEIRTVSVITAMITLIGCKPIKRAAEKINQTGGKNNFKTFFKVYINQVLLILTT